MAAACAPTAVVFHAASPDSFHDQLYRWLERTPWMALSLTAHVLVFLVLASIPWHAFEETSTTVVRVKAVLEPEVDPPFDPDPLETDPVDEPLPMPEEVVPVEASDPWDAADTDGDPTEDVANAPAFDSPFDSNNASFDEIGIGDGPSGGVYGKRPGGPGKAHIESALRAALDWLRTHQSADGSWDGDGFAERCGGLGGAETFGAILCDGPGSPVHDVGLTSLALLAFLGQGNTLQRGRVEGYRDVVVRAVTWLRRQQDPDSGLVGTAQSHDFLYDHALATLALCEAYELSDRTPLLRGPAQRAVELCLRARTPFAGWRYELPSIGDSDASLTGWMLLALCSARHAGLVVDEQALEDAGAWLDEVTDPNTGRVGYTRRGELSARSLWNTAYPPEANEALTGVGLFAQVFLQDGAERTARMEDQAALLLRVLPRWDADGRTVDFYAWYYATYALLQMGGKPWKRWQGALEPLLLEHQNHAGDARGSWDPVGAWGHVGGRVYATALGALCLEASFRYDRILGQR